ncbi:hypothetical protein U9M48_040681 [Paspalum notatum var. saurae]|uniref:Uncharacterized protein n=1 Tax=Paspalum notatum var. saurae TaxID=547442 RepID=A0AAQ3UM89_PASNO
MADGGDRAGLFLETSLGTLFVVSVPSRGTTVADLKSRLSAEHSLCFPGTAPIAVTSLQVERDGFWYVLSDSMDVQSAFGGVDRTWRLRVEADAECGSGDPEPSASHPISQNSMQDLSPPAAPKGDLASHTPLEYLEMIPGFGVAAGDSGMALSHQDKSQECLAHASGQHEEGSNNVHQQSSDRVVAAADNDTPPQSCQDQPHQGLGHSAVQRKDENTMSEQN